MYLLDTNVISELRKGHQIDRQVMIWAQSVSTSSLFVSVITILELEIGVLRKERMDPMQGSKLRVWLKENVLSAFSGRMLDIDVAVVQCCARLHVPDPKSDRDALIAATALVHGMTVVTRNTKDFEHTGVDVFNPWINALE